MKNLFRSFFLENAFLLRKINSILSFLLTLKKLNLLQSQSFGNRTLQNFKKPETSNNFIFPPKVAKQYLQPSKQQQQQQQQNEDLFYFQSIKLPCERYWQKFSFMARRHKFPYPAAENLFQK
jgi:hypothetical protein